MIAPLAASRSTEMGTGRQRSDATVLKAQVGDWLVRSGRRELILAVTGGPGYGVAPFVVLGRDGRQRKVWPGLDATVEDVSFAELAVGLPSPRYDGLGVRQVRILRRSRRRELLNMLRRDRAAQKRSRAP
jgi:hypothetical protein